MSKPAAPTVSVISQFNIPNTLPQNGPKTKAVVPPREPMTPEKVEHLMCKRVLVTDNFKIAETHIWELSVNRKFVKLGSNSPTDQVHSWIPVIDLEVVDVLAENFYDKETIQARIDNLARQRDEESKDEVSFVWRL